MPDDYYRQVTAAVALRDAANRYSKAVSRREWDAADAALAELRRELAAVDRGAPAAVNG